MTRRRGSIWGKYQGEGRAGLCEQHPTEQLVPTNPIPYLSRPCAMSKQLSSSSCSCTSTSAPSRPPCPSYPATLNVLLHPSPLQTLHHVKEAELRLLLLHIHLCSLRFTFLQLPPVLRLLKALTLDRQTTPEYLQHHQRVLNVGRKKVGGMERQEVQEGNISGKCCTRQVSPMLNPNRQTTSERLWRHQRVVQIVHRNSGGREGREGGMGRVLMKGFAYADPQPTDDDGIPPAPSACPSRCQQECKPRRRGEWQVRNALASILPQLHPIRSVLCLLDLPSPSTP